MRDRRRMARRAVTLEPRGEHSWDDKRQQFRSDLRRVLKSLAPATRVDAADHRSVLEKLAERDQEVAELETLADRQRTQIRELEAVKDRAAVAEIRRKSAGEPDVAERLAELIDEVKMAKPDDVPNVVFRHLVMDRFGKAGTIDWTYNGSDFETAVQRNLIDPDDGYSGRWGGRKLKPLAKALDAVATFLRSEEGREYADAQDDDAPLEPDDIDFWRTHLKI